MSEAAAKQSEHSGRDDNQRPQKAATESEGLFHELERFSRLSSDLKQCLSNIERQIKKSMDELNAIEQAIVQKKSELKEIYDVEASAAALANLIEEQRSQKEEFDGFIEREHRLWEKEKAKKEQEEEEYRRRWSEEQLAIRRNLEEELRIIQQKSIEKHKLMESSLLKREQDLEKKELEWRQLIQELELFMTRLVSRSQKDPATAESAEAVLKSPLPVGAGIPRSPVSLMDKKIMPDREEESGGNRPSSIKSFGKILLSQERTIDPVHLNPEENP